MPLLSSPSPVPEVRLSFLTYVLNLMLRARCTEDISPLYTRTFRPVVDIHMYMLPTYLTLVCIPRLCSVYQLAFSHRPHSSLTTVADPAAIDMTRYSRSSAHPAIERLEMSVRE